MIRSLYELRILVKDTRTHLFAMRASFKRGVVPDKIRFRMKSRLIMLKLRFLDVAQAVRETKGLTIAQAMTTRREMGGVNAALRDCDRMLAVAALAAQQAAPPEPGGLSWADLPAGGPVEPGDVALPDDPEASADDWLDALAPLPEEEGIELGSLPPLPAGQCPVCGEAEGADEALCPHCRVGYHRECWDYFGGCAIYGCRAAV